jgi:hypothetical protein
MSCVRGCCESYKEHIQGINIGSFPTATTYKERKLELDRNAYKAMRKDGVQPKGVMGAHVIQANADHVKEVEMGRPLDKQTKAVFDAGI